ncbi:MAG: DEAD/DEAH box helicase [Acidimicrobiia bacterium]|nr:DEAD/DEAH box helicase [Acidimicrobiia bacterium]MDJ0664417.1 DEAD/DEAH box helicase [Acidimicrobiia bacterium]
MTTFAQLGLPEPLVRALRNKDITEPFPVQEATIPDALAGRDVSGKAPTGSGKTLAFGLPLLTRIGKANRNKPQALILAPTRELAEQIKKELTAPAKAVKRYVFAVYGGVGYGPQRQALRRGVDVLVATPGRLEDLMEQGDVNLSQVKIVVVDEADRMADMGFLPSVRRILDKTPEGRQTLLFSATLDGDIATLTRNYQRNPVRHDAAGVEPETLDARHHFWLVDHHDRVQHTADVVGEAGRSIVFTRTRRGADRLARQLGKAGVKAVAMHGGLSQNQRNRALRSFSAHKTQALVATDVAARGIHIDAVESVIHYDPPADHKDYLHRSGRTARAGATGLVVSLVTGNQKRTVGRMKKELDLAAPTASPKIADLEHGGYRIGEPTRPGDRHNHRPAAPRPHADRKSAPDRGKENSIYVANLPWSHTDADLEDLFAGHGRVHAATVIVDRRTGRSKGFGFVDMPQRAARRAIAALHGQQVNGRDLTVRFAQPRKYGA